MNFYRKKTKELRKQKRIKINEMAKLLGVSPNTFSSWERNERNPSQTDVRVLAQILGVKVSDISDLQELNPTRKAYYYDSLGYLDKLQRDITGELTIEQQAMLVQLKNEIETVHRKNNTLEKENIKQRTIIETLEVFIYVKDIKRKFTEANPAFLSYTNNSKDEILFKANEDLFKAEEVITISSLERKVLETETRIVDYEIIIPGSNGKRIGLLSIYPVFSMDGKLSGIICSINDITTLTEARERRKLLESIINSLDESIWITAGRPVPHCLFVSNSVSKIFGRSSDEFYRNHKLWFEVVHPDDRKAVNEWSDSPIGENPVKEYRIIRSDGSTRWVLNHRYTVKEAGNLIKYGIVQDITERKNLYKRQEIQSSIINSLQDAVWIKFQSSQTYVSLNNAVEKIYGYSQNDFMNDTELWKKVIFPADRKKVMATLSKDHYKIEYRIISKDGTVKKVLDHKYTKMVNNEKVIFGVLRQVE